MGIKNQQFGQWKTKKLLGQGGNGEVWLVLNSSSKKAAIKFLTRIEGNRGVKVYERFKNEVKIIKESSEIDGVLSIIDSFLPDEIGEEIPWYVMPLAIPLTEYSRAESFDFETAVQVVIEVGKTLIELHRRGICHRDIKPENILIKDGKSFLSDFGLVDFPDKQDLTNTGERVGARWTIAPEMERDSKNADGKSADVYSLAKTLWILITDRKDGFEGQYNPDSMNGLSNFRLTEVGDEDFFLIRRSPLMYITPLDNLMRDSTNDDPSLRPNMNQFVASLESWIHLYKDFQRRNPLQWQEIQKKLFPMTLPQRVIWEDAEAIIEILNLLSSTYGLNHMHLPDGGGMDLLEVCSGHEMDTIELIVYERVAYIVKPIRLIFESFSFDMEWNYFRLETGDLEPTGLTFVYREAETLRELSPANYVSEEKWDDDRENDKNFPEDARLIKRYMRGDCLIIQKTSLYNKSGYTYDGKHNQMNSDEFRQFIAEKISLVKMILNDQQFMKEISDKDFDLAEAIFLYLEEIYRQEYLAKKSSNKNPYL